MKELFTAYKVNDEEEIIGHLNRLPECYKKVVQRLFDEITNKSGDKGHKVKTLPSPSPIVASKRENTEKMEISVPNIEVCNRFQVLAEQDKDLLQPTDIKERKIKPPPIIVKDKKNWPAISQLLKNTNSSPNTCYNNKDGIKMIFNEMTTFEKCLVTLGQHKIEYYTFKKKASN
ncbi:hypothetical protein JTB14_036204 [Gonioctena quinquepunctata]|nr:hypothetical protein JTB14_036204 [Gonioctena quinquepunctata]